MLIIWGPKRLPELGRSLGSGMRGFKDSVTGKDDEADRLEAPEQPAADRPTEPAGAAAAKGRDSAP